MYDPLDDDQEDVEVSSSAIYSPMSGCAFGKLDGNMLICLVLSWFQGFHDFVQEMVSLMATVGREVTAAT